MEVGVAGREAGGAGAAKERVEVKATRVISGDPGAKVFPGGLAGQGVRESKGSQEVRVGQEALAGHAPCCGWLLSVTAE